MKIDRQINYQRTNYKANGQLKNESNPSLQLSKLVDELSSHLPPDIGTIWKINNYKSVPTAPYIQHIPEDVEDVQWNFLKLCAKTLNSNVYISGKVHRQGIIGRYIEDSGIVELNTFWKRMMCIDDKYREWSQPYFAYNQKDMNDSNSQCINNIPMLLEYFRDKKIKTIVNE